MPQVKLKQGVKSSINNNAGVLNAGTLAVTTDTNELFITHNDGTVHQLCNPEIIPPIPVNSEDRYKYINHGLGRKPDVQVTDSNGNIVGVDIRHIDDNNIHLSWYGSIVGTIIIN